MTNIIPESIIFKVIDYNDNISFFNNIILNKNIYKLSEKNKMKRIYSDILNKMKYTIIYNNCFTSMNITEKNGKNVKYKCNMLIKDKNSIFCNFCNDFRNCSNNIQYNVC